MGTARGQEDLGLYRLTPRTGRTHQLRCQLDGLGIPIVDDPLYPVERDVPLDDFSAPLQLLAAVLAFDDPVDGTPRRFVTRRRLGCLAGTLAGPLSAATDDATWPRHRAFRRPCPSRRARTSTAV